MSAAAGLYLLGLTGMIAIRAPFVRRSLAVRVAASRETRGDRVRVAIVSLGILLPLLWVVTGAPVVAERRTSALALLAGAALTAVGLWLLHRAHVDLGRCWSNTLELRAGHRLVTGGVYSRLRHPMYTALLLYGAGQALVVPNWIAGPAFLLPFALLVAARLPAEEQMMADAFGEEWTAYAAHTGRLLPSRTSGRDSPPHRPLSV